MCACPLIGGCWLVAVWWLADSVWCLKFVTRSVGGSVRLTKSMEDGEFPCWHSCFTVYSAVHTVCIVQ